MSQENTKPTFNKYKKEAENNAIKLAQDMARMTNGSYDKDACQIFASQVINCTHRTLQQGIGNCFLTVIRQAAEAYDKGYYDLRNEMFYKWCKEVVTKTDCEFNFPTI